MANEEKPLIRIRVAILYTVAYLYEHREEADHHAPQHDAALPSLWHAEGGLLMNIGAMRTKITFQKNAVTVDKYGNHTNGWTDYCSCWATVGTSTGSESEGVVVNPEESLILPAGTLPSLPPWNPQNTGSSRKAISTTSPM